MAPIGDLLNGSGAGVGGQRLTTGLKLAVGAALISGFAIYLNAFAVKQLPDPAVFTTLKNGVAAALLIGLVVASGRLHEARNLDLRSWGAAPAVGVVGGSVPFILFFTGLVQASAPSAAFIHKTLFVWVGLLAVPFLGERLAVAPLAALAVLLAGQALVLPPQGIQWGIGETLILAATVLWALETIVVKRLLRSVSSHLMAALRLGIGLVVLVGYLGVTGKLATVVGLSAAQWSWALITGAILAVYVATWFAALQRAPASVVTSVLVLGAIVTGALTAASHWVVPDPTVVGGYGLILVGIGGVVLATLRSRAAPLPGAPAAHAGRHG